MKQLFKLTGCLALAGLFASCQSAQQEANYQIIPMPQEIVTAQGNPFILYFSPRSCRAFRANAHAALISATTVE